MEHPFLTTSHFIPWSQLAASSVVPDLTEALKIAEENRETLISQDRGKLSYESTFLQLENVTLQLERAWGLVQHLDAVNNNADLREAHNTIMPKISGFFSRLSLDEAVYDLLKTYASTEAGRAQTGIRKRFMDETLANYRLAGADLPQDKKNRLEAIDKAIAEATQKFSENVLDSTNAWERVYDSRDMLDGLPESALRGAIESAKQKGLGTDEHPSYRFTLHVPSWLPVMEYASNESVRRDFWKASVTIGHSGVWDNTELLSDILRLRQEKATLLNKSNFADLVLERRMAKNGATALNFVETLHKKIRSTFLRDSVTLQEFKAQVTQSNVSTLHPWDVAYWAEKQRSALYEFDEEELRPYFPINNVITGMFRLMERLFDIRIQERPSVCITPGSASDTPRHPEDPVEVWHPEVQFFDLKNSAGVLLGSFFTDWHPREAKRGGAWMNYLIGGRPPSTDSDRIPHLGLIAGNMTRPIDDKVALLTHAEVQTIFHEFGHLLHQLLGNVEIRSLNGVSVAWDFVELPSQIMENFCWHRESLDLFARHFETGEPIPARLFKRMIAAKNYRAASNNMRQLSLGKLDLELHINHADGDFEHGLDSVTRDMLHDYLTPLTVVPPSMARRFTHLFGSSIGYAAGYYSYKWAEVLDADAFSRFIEEGLLNPEIGLSFRDHILSMGNSLDPAELFRNFMGRDPDADALLRRDGLLA